MHPALRHRYGLRSDEDVAIAEHFRASARKAGVSDATITRMLEFYGAQLVPRLETGAVDANGALEQLMDFARTQNVGALEQDALLSWYGGTRDHLDQHGELPALPAPDLRAAATELAEIEQIAQNDPGRYWKDEALQHRMYELLELTQAADDSAGPQPAPAKMGADRMKAIEASMYLPNGSPNPAYWKSPDKQAEYRNLVNVADAAAPPAIAGEPQASAGASGPARSAE
jgi:hypothetical protein